MTSSSDVIIAGGGIMGCLTAYHLGQYGLKCTIIERDSVGSQASGSAAGLLNPLSGAESDPGQAEFALEAYRLHRQLAQELWHMTAIDYHYAETPMLRPAFTEEEVADLRRQFAGLQSYGANPLWLEGDSLRPMFTWLAHDVQAAVYTPREGQVECSPLMAALAQAIKAQGAIVREGEVVGLKKGSHRITGVSLADGTILEGGSILLAMGPWSKFAGEWMGVNIPVEPLRGQILRLSLPSPPVEYSIAYDRGYVTPKAAGHLLAGTTEEFAGFVRQVTPQGQASIMKDSLRIAPILQGASLIETTACLRPLCLDGLPIIGQVPGWDNLYIATGHGRKGILLGTATGKYLAQLMATGECDWDLSPYSPRRLAS